MLSANPRIRETGTWGRISLFRLLEMLADPDISVHRFFSSIMSQNYPSHFKTILISVAPIFELISSSPFGTKPHFS